MQVAGLCEVVFSNWMHRLVIVPWCNKLGGVAFSMIQFLDSLCSLLNRVFQPFCSELVRYVALLDDLEHIISCLYVQRHPSFTTGLMNMLQLSGRYVSYA